MENQIENADSPNGDTVVTEELDTTALKEQLTKVNDSNKQLFERAKKAEIAEKELKEKLKGLTDKPAERPVENQPNDIDYKELALKSYLKSEGVNHPDDQKAVKDEAARLKLPIDEVLGMEHIKSRLQTMKENREAQDAIPKGRGRTGSVTPSDVEYHLAKGTTPDDQELAEKVVNARIAKETSKNTFSDVLYD